MRQFSDTMSEFQETTRRRDPHSEKPENNEPACTLWRGNDDLVCAKCSYQKEFASSGGGSLDIVSLKNEMACDRNDKIALRGNLQILMSEFQETTTSKLHTHF